MPFAKRENIQLYYELKGQDRPLLLINGFTNHLGMWDPYLSSLEERFSVLRFDPRGAGRSDVPPGPYTIQQMADDVIFLMDCLSIDQAEMIGFSMGSAIIQSLALDHPDRLGKVVMLSPFDRFPMNAYLQARSSAKLRDSQTHLNLIIEYTLPWIYSSQFLSSSSRVKATIEDLENNPYPQFPEGYDWQLEALHQFDETKRLSQIKHDVLLIAGEQDLYTPIYTAQALKKNLKNATLEILPEVGHMLHIERKYEVLKLILSWLLQK